MKIVRRGAVLAFAIALLAAAPAIAGPTQAPSSSPAPSAIAGWARNGKTVTLHPGQTLVVQLDSNRTTGYGWSGVPPSGAVLIQEGAPVYATVQPSNQRVGAGGRDVFKYKAAAKGRVQISLAYERRWEKVPPAKTFALTVLIE
jgi:inhibitor of cysteine peptidase